MSEEFTALGGHNLTQRGHALLARRGPCKALHRPLNRGAGLGSKSSEASTSVTTCLTHCVVAACAYGCEFLFATGRYCRASRQKLDIFKAAKT